MNLRKVTSIAVLCLCLLGACGWLPGNGPDASDSGDVVSQARPTSTPVPPPEPFPDGPAAPTSLNVPLRIENTSGLSGRAVPVTSGVPLPAEAAITNPATLRLVDAGGNPVPAQFTPTARWDSGPGASDGALRWLLVDTQVSTATAGTPFLFLQEGGPGPAPPMTLSLTESSDTLAVDTGVAQFSISLLDGGLSGTGLSAPVFGRLSTPDGVYTASGPVEVRVALAGPLRASVHVTGSLRDAAGNALLDYTSRYWFYAGQPTLRLFYTLENNSLCPLAEYAQPDCYDIGSGGSVSFDDFSLVAPTSPGGRLAVRAGEGGQPASEFSQQVVVYQDSSGTDFWNVYPEFRNWNGRPLDAAPRMQAYVTFRGYRTLVDGLDVDSGDQARGWLEVSGSDGAWSVGVRDFWQNFPKALRALPDGTLEVGLFPAEFGGDDTGFVLRAGEHKTHEIVLGPSAGGDSLLAAPFAAAPPEWYVDSGALGLTALPDWAAWQAYEAYLLAQLETAPGHDSQGLIEPAPGGGLYGNIFDAIEGTDFYGMFDYGDWPVDYEGVEVSPLNLKYDVDYGLWLQWARTGDPRWFDLAGAADRHFADVDILHNLHSPRHWADGIAFGHSYHDEEGFLNPHRNYGGGNPDTTFGAAGMLLYSDLTGYEKSRESALELADAIDYRVRNDEHLCDVFPECNGEGYALGAGLYDAGSRPAANALFILVAAYRATGEARYLESADALVNWARPANQPYINGPNGADLMMRPWMLNLYLRALTEYIEVREAFGLPDTVDARGSYVSYANWLRTYAWLDLSPLDSGPRGAYPYEWWLDGRQGNPNDEGSAGNNVPSTNSWLLLGADTMAYAYHLSGDADYLARAETLFRTASRDPWYEGDVNAYGESKETVNAVVFGQVFLYVWAER